ncbi:MAG: methylaspartate mutase subunit S [Dehalococcoidales bacterium]|nr:methylaspartate mutase subunit S [Dehalococcoidales bacterium]
MSESKGTIVTGVIGDDVHVVGIRILEHALKKAGFKVVPLGVQVSQVDFINAAIETNADVIMVSSLSGHAQLLLPGLRDKCTESGLENILLYLGGQLAIHRTQWEDVEAKYREMGINWVCPPEVMPEKVVAKLDADLAMRRR